MEQTLADRNAECAGLYTCCDRRTQELNQAVVERDAAREDAANAQEEVSALQKEKAELREERDALSGKVRVASLDVHRQVAVHTVV